MTHRLNYPGFTAALLRCLFAERGLSIRQIAEATEQTFEFVRKVLRGECLPSKTCLSDWCRRFEFKRQTFAEPLLADRMAHELGPHVWTAVGKNPELAEVYALWPYWSDEDRRLFVALVNAYTSGSIKRPSARRAHRSLTMRSIR